MCEELICPNCGKRMVKVMSKYGMFFSCSGWPDCDTSVGAHKSGDKCGQPLGTPADRETRQARVEAHKFFDELWKWPQSAGYTVTVDTKDFTNIRRTMRLRAYSWLADKLGIPVEECHISMMDYSLCMSTIALCKTTTSMDIRLWWKNKVRREQRKRKKRERNAGV